MSATIKVAAPSRATQPNKGEVVGVGVEMVMMGITGVGFDGRPPRADSASKASNPPTIIEANIDPSLRIANHTRRKEPAADLVAREVYGRLVKDLPTI